MLVKELSSILTGWGFGDEFLTDLLNGMIVSRDTDFEGKVTHTDYSLDWDDATVTLYESYMVDGGDWVNLEHVYEREVAVC